MVVRLAVYTDYSIYNAPFHSGLTPLCDYPTPYAAPFVSHHARRTQYIYHFLRVI